MWTSSLHWCSHTVGRRFWLHSAYIRSQTEPGVFTWLYVSYHVCLHFRLPKKICKHSRPCQCYNNTQQINMSAFVTSRRWNYKQSFKAPFVTRCFVWLWWPRKQIRLVVFRSGAVVCDLWIYCFPCFGPIPSNEGKSYCYSIYFAQQ